MSLKIVSVPIDRASYDYVPPDLESRKTSEDSMDTPETSDKKNAIISGDSHGNERTIMQKAAFHGVIALNEPEADWEILSRLTQSTILDQLKAADDKRDSIEEEITECTNRQLLCQEELNKLQQLQLLESSNTVNIVCISKELTEINDNLVYLNHLQSTNTYLIEVLCEQARIEKILFQTIIDEMIVLDTQTLDGDLGDGICDRHNNERKRLYYNKKFKEKGGKNFALESNHSLETHLAYLLQRWDVNDPLFMMGNNRTQIPTEARSLTNLRTSIAHNIDSIKEINELMEDWLDSLHLITYSCSKGVENSSEKPSITIYSHAPIGLGTISDLAVKYDLPYQDKTVEELCQTIDAIDACFRKSVMKDTKKVKALLNNIYQLMNIYQAKYLREENEQALQETYDITQDDLLEMMKDQRYLIENLQMIETELLSETDENKKQHAQHILTEIKQTFLYQILEEIDQMGNENEPFDSSKLYPEKIITRSGIIHCFWNRYRENLRRNKEHHGYECYFVNGHDTPEGQQDNNICELNNLYGKALPPKSVQYSMQSLHIDNLNIVGENETFFFISFHFFSETGKLYLADGSLSSSQKVPGHYFNGIIPVGKEGIVLPQASTHKDILERIIQIPAVLERIKEEMNDSSSSVILHNNNSINMHYLDVKNEVFSPLLSHHTKPTMQLPSIVNGIMTNRKTIPEPSVKDIMKSQIPMFPPINNPNNSSNGITREMCSLSLNS